MLLLRLLLWEGAAVPAEALPFDEGDHPRWRAKAPGRRFKAGDPGRGWRARDPGRRWRAGGRHDVIFAEKEARSTWKRFLNFDFAEYEELQGGETILTASVTISPAGPSLSAASFSGTVVQTFAQGLTAGERYTLTALITTSGGATVDQLGFLDVE